MEPIERPWDPTFERWIELGRAEGVDPNDIGDREWNDPATHIESFYRPHVRPNSVVLELGPGTGRITRHLIGHCEMMILADFSKMACRWLDKYLTGKGRFRTVWLEKPAMPQIAAASVDFAFAFGVFEHIGVDSMRWYLEELHRVVKPGGRVIFNFDNLMTEEGLAWHTRWRGQPGDTHVFSFYHPDAVAWLAKNAGFTVDALRTGPSRLAEIELVKP